MNKLFLSIVEEVKERIAIDSIVYTEWQKYPPLAWNAIICREIGKSSDNIVAVVLAKNEAAVIGFMYCLRKSWIKAAAVTVLALQSFDIQSGLSESKCADISDLVSAIMGDIKEERGRQNKKFGVQNHPPAFWNAIILEEIGEASKEILNISFAKEEKEELQFIYNLRAEWVQVAASIIAALECIDRQTGGELK